MDIKTHDILFGTESDLKEYFKMHLAPLDSKLGGNSIEDQINKTEKLGMIYWMNPTKTAKGYNFKVKKQYIHVFREKRDIE